MWIVHSILLRVQFCFVFFGVNLLMQIASLINPFCGAVVLVYGMQDVSAVS